MSEVNSDADQVKFLVGIHYSCFRPGTPATVLGERTITPEGCAPRVCYYVRFGDGLETDIAAHHPPESSEKSPYIALLTREDLAAGRIPEVTWGDRVGDQL